MLSAESVALQARLVQQLAALRQQELDYIVHRYNALGTQSALIAAFIIGTWQNVYMVHVGQEGGNMITRLFFACTYIATMSSVLVIVITMFVSNWAPGVALNGASGSMTRSLEAARNQGDVINRLFMISIIGFIAQILLTAWMMAHAEESCADSQDAVIGTVIIAAFSLFASRLVRKMHADFYGDGSATSEWGSPDDKHARDNKHDDQHRHHHRQHEIHLDDHSHHSTHRSSLHMPASLHLPSLFRHKSHNSASADEDKGSERRNTIAEAADRHAEDEKLRPLLAAVDHRLDNPMGLVEAHPDLAHHGAAAAENFSLSLSRELEHRPAVCEMSGHLRKRVNATGMGSLGPMQWRDRFFVLSEGTLLYWVSPRPRLSHVPQPWPHVTATATDLPPV